MVKRTPAGQIRDKGLHTACGGPTNGHERVIVADFMMCPMGGQPIVTPSPGFDACTQRSTSNRLRDCRLADGDLGMYWIFVVIRISGER